MPGVDPEPCDARASAVESRDALDRPLVVERWVAGDPETGALTTEGLEVIAEAPLGGLILGRGVASRGDG